MTWSFADARLNQPSSSAGDVGVTDWNVRPTPRANRCHDGNVLRPMQEHPVSKVRKNRRRTGREAPSAAFDLEPIVERTLQMLANSPKGASRVDILSAMNLQPNAWSVLREALEETGVVHSVGRGPGLRHVHTSHLGAVPDEARVQRQPEIRGEQLAQARSTLRNVLQNQGEIDSSAAQDATGLRADPVRRLLLELVEEGLVERSGKKRSMRYRWVG